MAVSTKNIMSTVAQHTNKGMPSVKTIISAAASAAAAVMFLRSVAKDFLPREVQEYFVFKFKTFLKAFSSELTLVIEEFENLNQNRLFEAVEVYLQPIIPPNTQRLKVSLINKETQPSVSLDRNQEVFDTYKGVTFKWLYVPMPGMGKRYVKDPNDYYNSIAVADKGWFELSFHKKYKSFVIDDYLNHIVEKTKETRENKKTLKIFTLIRDRMMCGRGNPWEGVNLEHPATFDTVAMDVEVRRTIMVDLERFLRRKEFYRKVGKAWKRGYLLFGPPGTGKSSLIAAMANYLKFDIYDMELTALRGVNTDLRSLLVSTANKSILVVEDIDCSIEFQDRQAKARASPNHHLYNQGYQPQPELTLSGLLNFIDGLWSSLGDERIIIFTTNHKEKLDPALLRPGRMDVHIHMTYCTPPVFEMLASNYFGITEHPLFAEVEELIGTTDVTPAEVGEQLMRSEEPEIAFRSLIDFLQDKKSKIEQRKKSTSSRSNKKKTRSDGSEARKEQVEAVSNLNLQELPENNEEIENCVMVLRQGDIFSM